MIKVKNNNVNVKANQAKSNSTFGKRLDMIRNTSYQHHYKLNIMFDQIFLTSFTWFLLFNLIK